MSTSPSGAHRKSTRRGSALRATVSSLILAVALGACSARSPEIVDRPISFSGDRVEMTRAYIRQHYGLEDPSITITPKIVVLHWTAVGTFERSYAVFHRETLGGRPDLESAGQVNVSVQFLVDRDGTIYRLMPEMWMGRHVIGLNYDAIGVENVGGTRGEDDLTDAQIEANIRLVRYLAERYSTIEYLIGHHEYRLFEGHPLWRELDPDYRTEKSDPGERFMSAVRDGVDDLGLKGAEDVREETPTEQPASGPGQGAASPGGDSGDDPGGDADPGVETPEVIPHEAWEATPPTGHEAEATRRNLPEGGSLTFRGLSVTIGGMAAGREEPQGDDEAAPDTVTLTLGAGGKTERATVTEGTAFNWEGYHLAVLAVNADPGELGGGLVELEVATVESLPPEVAASDRAGGAESRLRVPHEIDAITLHHSGSAEPLRPDDDPVEKLRGLQEWGATARNWWDVPYHFLLDLDGNVYEGRDYRYVGETNTGYDPRGHLLISVLGNYDRQDATEAQVETIRELIAWASQEFDVPPERIRGHGDVAETSCPGEHLRKYLEDGTFIPRRESP